MIDDANEYEAISRLFDLVCQGKGDSSELALLDSQIAKGLEQAYRSAEPTSPTSA